MKRTMEERNMWNKERCGKNREVKKKRVVGKIDKWN